MARGPAASDEPTMAMTPEHTSGRPRLDPATTRRWLDRSERLLDGRPGLLLVVALALLATAYWMVLGRQVTFRGDDIDFLLSRSGWSLDPVLQPHVGHLVALTVLYLRVMWSTVGLDPGWPYLMLNGLVWSASVVGAFVLVRRRVGPWLALGGVVVLLLLDAGAEDLLWPFQMGNLLAVTLGVGGLLALDRSSRRGDVAAFLLLGAAVATGSYGLIFLAGATLELLLGRRWRRLWVVAVTIVAYAAWRLAYHPTTDIPLSGPRVAARFAFDYLSYAWSAFGVLPLAIGRVLAVASTLWVLGLIVVRRGLGPREAAVVALPVTTLLLTSVARGSLGTPNAGRYLLPLALMLALLVGYLGRRWRPTPTGLALALVVVLGLAAANVRTSHTTTSLLRGTGKAERTALGALQLARPSVAPSFRLEPASAYGATFTARGWFAATDHYGSSPAYDLAELRALPSPDRAFADSVLASASRLAFVPATAGTGGPPPTVTTTGGSVRESGSCTTVRPGSSHLSNFALPEAGVVLRPTPGDSLTLRGRRFSDAVAPTILSSATATDQRLQLLTPVDRAPGRWSLQIEHGAPLSICTRAAS